MNSTFPKTLRLLAALVAMLGLGSCGGGGSDGPAAQTIALFTPIADQRFSDVPVALTALSSSGLGVQFSTPTPAVCRVTGNTVALLAVGTCTVAADQPGSNNFQAAPQVTRSFAVTPADQTITFVSPGNQVFGSVPPALMAVSTSGLPVSILSATPAVCAVSGTTLSLLGLGDCTLAAVQTGNNTYRPAPQVQQTFTVSTRGQAQTITFASPGAQVLNVAPPALAATASSGLPVSFAATTPSVCSVTGTALSLLISGNCTVAASQGGDPNFAAAPAVLNTFAVSGRPQTITFASPGNQTLGAPTTPLVGTATSGLGVTFTSTTAAVCTVNGTVLTLRDVVGACSISANQEGSTLFAPAVPVVRQFNVLPAEQIITFAGLGNQTLGTAAPALSATSSRGLVVAFESTTPTVCSVSGTAVTLRTTGTCTIHATQAGNAVVAAAAAVSRSFQVAAAPLTVQAIAFVPVGNQTLGTPVPALVATSSASLPVTFTSSTPLVCEVSGTAVSLLSAGDCTITASQPGNSTTAAATPAVQTFTVARRTQSITFNSPGGQTLGTAVPALVATASSSLPVTFVSTTPLVCGVSGTAVSLLTAGNCTVVASQAGNATYAPAAVVSHTFAVGTVPLTAQTITFAGPGAQTFAVGLSLPLMATTTATGLTVSFAASPAGVCAASGTTLSIQGAGACTVTASQSGNSTFAAAPDVSRVVTVAKAAQSITFNPPGDQIMGTSPTLTATASSGLGVTLTSASSACSVSGNVLTLVSAGPCTVTATQGGNGNYNAAAPVPQTFNVVQVSQTINFANPGTQVANTTLSLSATAVPSGLTVAFTASSPTGACSMSGITTVTLSTAGTCTVTANQAGNVIFAAASPVARTFTVDPAPPASQAITFTDPGAQVVGVPLTLSATASSNLTVSFASTTTSVCTVSGNTLTLSNTGPCTIRASQAGDGSFLAAPTVDRSFSVLRNALANVGFEEVANNSPAGEFANGWLAATVDPSIRIATRSTTEFRSGGASAFLTITDGQNGGVGLFQNSIDHGQLAAVNPLNWTKAPTLTFWYKGNVSETGNLNYALRYLDASGNILSTSFGSVIVITGNVDRPWTQFTRTPNTVIPVNTAAVLLEMTLAAGPSGTFPGCGPTGSFCNWGTPALYIDDIRLLLEH